MDENENERGWKETIASVTAVVVSKWTEVCREAHEMRAAAVFLFAGHSSGRWLGAAGFLRPRRGDEQSGGKEEQERQGEEDAEKVLKVSFFFSILFLFLISLPVSTSTRYTRQNSVTAVDR